MVSGVLPGCSVEHVLVQSPVTVLGFGDIKVWDLRRGVVGELGLVRGECDPNDSNHQTVVTHGLCGDYINMRDHVDAIEKHQIKYFFTTCHNLDFLLMNVVIHKLE